MNSRSNAGYEELGIAIVRQAVSDFDEASRYLTRSSSEEQYDRILKNCKGGLSDEQAKILYKESHCRWVIKDVSEFLESKWCLLCINGYDGSYYLEQLLFRDWRRQCIADGIAIPRGEEFVPRRDFTKAEVREYRPNKNFKGYYSHRNDAEISKWYGSLSDDELIQMSRTRSFDAETFRKVFGIKWVEK